MDILSDLPSYEAPIEKDDQQKGNIYIFFRILKYFNTHIHGERREDLKETDSGVYLKEPNSWIHSMSVGNIVKELIVEK